LQKKKRKLNLLLIVVEKLRETKFHWVFLSFVVSHCAAQHFRQFLFGIAFSHYC